MIEKTYAEGLQDGKITSLEEKHDVHTHRLNIHDSRLTSQERITYAILGALALLEALPMLRAAIG